MRRVLYREKTPYYERDNRSPRGWYLRAVVLAAVELNESREARVAAEGKGKPARGGKPRKGSK